MSRPLRPRLRDRFAVRGRPGTVGIAERRVVLVAVLCGMLLSLTIALTDAPYATGDEPPHVDYAYQVWHGELPVFEDGLDLRPDGAWLAPVQWTAQHPPLYYLLVAPLVGPLADAGHPVAAVYAARGVNVLLSGVFVLAAWWSARRLTRPGSVLPPLVAFLAGAMPAAAHVGGGAYNDLLAATGVTVLFGLSATVVRRGLDARLIALLSLVAATCALTRLSAALIAAVVAGVALLAGAVRAAQGRGRWAHVAALAAAGPGAVLATSGWFYLRNLELTGNLTGSHFDWALANQNRQERPVWAVLADPVTWTRLPDLFWWAGRLPPNTALTATTLVVTALLLVWTPLVIALVVTIRRRRASTRGAAPGAGAPASAAGPGDAPAHPTDRLLLRALPVVAVLVSVSVQVGYAASSGGVYPRYLLVVSLPLCLALAAGLAVRPRLLVPAWTALTLLDLVVWLSVELTTPAPPGYYSELPLPAAVVGALAAAAVAVSAVLALRAVAAGSVSANRAAASTAATPTAATTRPTPAS